MASLIYGVNLTIGIIFFVMYFYQIIYLIVGLVDKQKQKKEYVPKKQHKIAVLISARNESKVIGELCRSEEHTSELQSRI